MHNIIRRMQKAVEDLFASVFVHVPYPDFVCTACMNVLPDFESVHKLFNNRYLQESWSVGDIALKSKQACRVHV